MKYPQICCACNQTKRSRNLVMLPQKALTPGKGWGCVQCGLSMDGAIAAICDECAASGAEIHYALDGWIEEGKRVPLSELPQIRHEHNAARHPEMETEER